MREDEQPVIEVPAWVVAISMIVAGTLWTALNGSGIGKAIREVFNEETSDSDSDEDEIDYSTLYYPEFRALPEKDVPEAIDKACSTWVEEDTPFGEVWLTYNKERQTFDYYSDSRSAPYNVLDALARKLAVDTECKGICVDTEEQTQRLIDRAEAAEKIAKEAKERRAGGVFATLKTYESLNTGTKRAPIDDSEYAMNRFTWKGALRERRPPGTSTGKQSTSNLSYAAFRLTSSASTSLGDTMCSEPVSLGETLCAEAERCGSAARSSEGLCRSSSSSVSCGSPHLVEGAADSILERLEEYHLARLEKRAR